MKVRIIKSAIVAASLLGSALSTGVAAATPNTSSYSMQLSGNTISVYETSTEGVNTVSAAFTYSDPQGAIQSVSVGLGSTFTTCFDQTSAKVTCSALGGSITGTNLVANLTINLKAGVSSANVTVGMGAGSMILSSTDNSDTLNHSTLPSSTYDYTAPVSTPSVPAQNHATSNSSTTQSSSAAANPTADNSSSTVTTASDKPKPAKTTTSVAKTTDDSSKAGVVTSTIAAAVVLGAAVYWLVLRKGAELKPAVYKLAGIGSKSSTKAVSTKKAPVTKKTAAAKRKK